MGLLAHINVMNKLCRKKAKQTNPNEEGELIKCDNEVNTMDALKTFMDARNPIPVGKRNFEDTFV